jgi:biopolymer transport protein ExbB
MGFRMRRYARSKFRILLLTGMLGAIIVMATQGFAQDAPPPPAGIPGAAAEAVRTGDRQGLVNLILNHPDPVFFTIAALSVAGVTFIIQGFIRNRASVYMPPESVGRIRELIQSRQFNELLEFTEQDPSFVSKALNPALKRAPSFIAMKEAMETSIGEQTAERFRSIEYLNIIGNLGPLLGLLGTVLGMIYAFDAMQAAGGSAAPAQLALGISTALTHTFLGLFLAVPCLAAFGVLRTIVDRLTVRAALVSEDLLLMVRPQEARTATAPPRVPAATAAAPPPPHMEMRMAVDGSVPRPPVPTPMPMTSPAPSPPSVQF